MSGYGEFDLSLKSASRPSRHHKADHACRAEHLRAFSARMIDVITGSARRRAAPDLNAYPSTSSSMLWGRAVAASVLICSAQERPAAGVSTIAGTKGGASANLTQSPTPGIARARGFVARISIDADFAAEAAEFQAARTQAGRPSSSMRLSALTAILTSHRRRESSLERKASPITRL
jgi:hypothetical protein